MKITFLVVHSEDHAPGMPIWRYSLACAYLQSYLTTSHTYSALTFSYVMGYQSSAPEKLVAEILQYEPDILAASCYCWNWQLFRRVLPEVRKARPNVKIVAGGPEFDLQTGPTALAAHPELDMIVLGEGEATFKDVVEKLFELRTTADRSAAAPSRDRAGLPMLTLANDFTSIPGLVVRNAAGEVTMTGCRDVIPNLDDIPSPYATWRTGSSRSKPNGAVPSFAHSATTPNVSSGRRRSATSPRSAYSATSTRSMRRRSANST
jgi:radical SAM superfamily enzyme YgiQ (UPF0313 family)